MYTPLCHCWPQDWPVHGRAADPTDSDADHGDGGDHEDAPLPPSNGNLIVKGESEGGKK